MPCLKYAADIRRVPVPYQMGEVLHGSLLLDHTAPAVAGGLCYD